MPHLHIGNPGLYRIVWGFSDNPSVWYVWTWCNCWSESSSPGELTPGKTWLWGRPLNGRGSNKRPGPQKAQGFRHLTLVLSANRAQFQHPGASDKKSLACFCAYLHVEGSWISDPPPTPHTYIHIHWLQPPPAFGDLHCRNSCQGNSLSQRERESERGSTGGREGNQLLEKYCLSIPCQELVCVVAFFWASVALALWLQPPTPLSTVNSTMGGLGRKLTKTTAKQNRFLKCVCFCMCVYVRLCSGIAEICSRFSHMLICGWQSGVRKKDFMLWYHSKYP